MLWPMNLLAVDAAISHEFASGAYLELYVVDCCFSAVSTHLLIHLIYRLFSVVHDYDIRSMND